MKIKPMHYDAIKQKLALSWKKGLIIAIILALFGSGLYSLYGKNKEVKARISDLQSTIEFKEQSLLQASSTNATLSDTLRDREEEIQSLKSKVTKISKTAKDLEKLTKTDKQLLEKYSKVYFLNENYTPAKLDNIPDEYLFIKEKPIQVHASVLDFLDDMLDDAKSDGIDLRVLSGYRSFETQATLKSNYKMIYGAGTANQFSADQGYSEHQLGTTVDFTTPAMGSSLTTSFEDTAAFKWLTTRGYRYGFILSYPKGNAYYQYEPWHWRFVGKDLARRLHREKKNFYDLDQRDINEYLLELFD